MRSFKYIVKDESGLHARPVGLLVKQVVNYKCEVTISKGEKSVNAKRLFGVMGLGVKQNETISLCFDGEDENEAYDSTKAFCEANF